MSSSLGLLSFRPGHHCHINRTAGFQMGIGLTQPRGGFIDSVVEMRFINNSKKAAI